jgi:hypothetical protein
MPATGHNVDDDQRPSPAGPLLSINLTNDTPPTGHCRAKTVVGGLPRFDAHSGVAVTVARLGVPDLGHNDAVTPRRSGGALNPAALRLRAYRPARPAPDFATCGSWETHRDRPGGTSRCFLGFSLLPAVRRPSDGPGVDLARRSLTWCELGGDLLAARVLPAGPRGGVQGMRFSLAPHPSGWQPSRRAVRRSPPSRPHLRSGAGSGRSPGMVNRVAHKCARPPPCKGVDRYPV